MSVTLNILQALFGFCAAVFGVAGNTWDASRPSLLRRVTLPGWTAIILALCTLAVTVIKEIRNDRVGRRNSARVEQLQGKLLAALERQAISAPASADRDRAKAALVTELRQQSTPPPTAEPPPNTLKPIGPEPPWLTLARAEVGVKESGTGKGNPRILEYLASTSLAGSPLDEKIPWSAAFVNWVLKQAGIETNNSPVSRAWVQWGSSASPPHPGSLVINRASGSWHIGFFVRDEGDSVAIIGGNANNSVKYQLVSKKFIVDYRDPPNA